jgi:hypothetical protein
MRMTMVILIVAFSETLALAQPAQANPYNFFGLPKATPQSMFTTTQTPNLLEPRVPVVPPNIGNFNEGVFSAKEQFHDLQISDMGMRLRNIEGTINWMSGVIWAAGIFFVIVVACLKLFWKGIARVVIAEVTPRIIP